MSAFAPQIVLAGLVAVFIIAFSKGAFGGGLAVVGIPILALVMDPVDAALVLAPLLFVMDLVTLRVFPPRTWSMPDVRWIAAGLFCGMLVGAYAFSDLPRDVAGGLIGAAILAFAVRQLFFRPAPGTPLGVSFWRAFVWGGVGGLTTFLANAGQPPVAVYLTRRQLPKTIYAGTMSAVFTLANATRIPLVAGLILARPSLMLYSAALLPAIPLGAYVGKVMHDRIDRDRLFRIVYVLIMLAGAKVLGSSLGLVP
ncbi:sulfite exporter TauE/SafE family protein [Aquabacter cavernae]|uniref:sulfite exporter TauE/SafE family protein n=1 Tax=Aquabacter cavernae TaxID=2496029 RepID=UPI0013E0D97F|nr:sulfite exporter TauE/SafE family protein [Aquabacter cavernae]